jgi:hypothetical protein
MKCSKLQHPQVPSTVPASLTSLIFLETLHILGNSSVPSMSGLTFDEIVLMTLAGTFPSALLQLPQLKTLDIEYTALTGPLPPDVFAKASKLNSLLLINNVQLGSTLPSVAACTRMVTL